MGLRACQLKDLTRPIGPLGITQTNFYFAAQNKGPCFKRVAVYVQKAIGFSADLDGLVKSIGHHGLLKGLFLHDLYNKLSFIFDLMRLAEFGVD